MDTDFYFERLHTLRQLSTVNIYQKQFALLSSLVVARYPYLDEAYFVSCCINGLAEEIRSNVLSFLPSSIDSVFSLARLQEHLISFRKDSNNQVALASEATVGIFSVEAQLGISIDFPYIPDAKDEATKLIPVAHHSNCCIHQNVSAVSHNELLSYGVETRNLLTLDLSICASTKSTVSCAVGNAKAAPLTHNLVNSEAITACTSLECGSALEAKKETFLIHADTFIAASTINPSAVLTHFEAIFPVSATCAEQSSVLSDVGVAPKHATCSSIGRAPFDSVVIPYGVQFGSSDSIMDRGVLPF